MTVAASQAGTTVHAGMMPQQTMRAVPVVSTTTEVTMENEHPSMKAASDFIKSVVGDVYHEIIPSPKKFSKSKKVAKREIRVQPRPRPSAAPEPQAGFWVAAGLTVLAGMILGLRR